MRGLSPPPHAIPPAPTITSVLSGPLGVRVYWQGSAGATDYSVERRAADGGPWIAVCRRCVTDADDGYADADPAARGAWYRVVPYNLDGRAGRSSNAVQASG
jgi:hypothetical protein